MNIHHKITNQKESLIYTFSKAGIDFFKIEKAFKRLKESNENNKLKNISLNYTCEKEKTKEASNEFTQSKTNKNRIQRIKQTENPIQSKQRMPLNTTRNTESYKNINSFMSKYEGKINSNIKPKAKLNNSKIPYPKKYEKNKNMNLTFKTLPSVKTIYKKDFGLGKLLTKDYIQMKDLDSIPISPKSPFKTKSKKIGLSNQSLKTKKKITKDVNNKKPQKKINNMVTLLNTKMITPKTTIIEQKNEEDKSNFLNLELGKNKSYSSISMFEVKNSCQTENNQKINNLEEYELDLENDDNIETLRNLNLLKTAENSDKISSPKGSKRSDYFPSPESKSTLYLSELETTEKINSVVSGIYQSSINNFYKNKSKNLHGNYISCQTEI
ncbi:MAG: hypothetical protein MJ252_20350 [archaeon]|nr:hypothetical protein [archaeon]